MHVPRARAAPAYAHAFLDHATPAVGSTVHGSPPRVELWFTQELEPAFSTVRVLDQGNERQDKGDVKVDPRDATIAGVAAAACAGPLSGRMARAVRRHARHRRRLHLRGRAVDPAEDLRPRMDRLNALLVVSRALHFAAALLISGGLVLGLVVVDPASANVAAAARRERTRRGFLRTAAVGTGRESAVRGRMAPARSGVDERTADAEATSGGTLWLVLTGTGFGRVWMWRFVIAAALGALMFAAAAAARAAVLEAHWLALALAGGYLASLALVGHAADGQGAERFLRIITDAVHLLAAGAWLGALPGLAVLFASACARVAPQRSALPPARRGVSPRLGIASVGALLASGLVNAWFLVGDVPALLGTPYGQLLLAKICCSRRWWRSPRSIAGV